MKTATGTEYIKDYAEIEVKQYYDNEDELFDYAGVPNSYKTKREPLYEEDYYQDEYEDIDKDDFEISL